MKRIVLFVAVLSFSGIYAKNDKIKEINIVLDDCMTVYHTTKKAAIDQGFSSGDAQEIAAAAYYTCRGKTTLKKNELN